MPISEVRQRFCAILAIVLACSGPALALDGSKTDPDDRSPIDAFKEGARALKAGDMLGASKALEFAAGHGHALAQWKLARMYAEGDGVPKDDVKAFRYYEAIANAHADESRDSPEARVVSSAFVALGVYYLNGLPEADLKPDPSRAADLFHFAASYFGDENAQYNLGRIFLDGAPGIPAEPKRAARWLRLSADKGQHQAQAVLGHMLFAGAGVPKQAARGLMYLTLARDGADASADRWIVDLYDQAFAAAAPEEREMALTYLEQHLAAQ